MSNNCNHSHNEEEHCDCCCCCDEEKELVRDRRELTDEEIEKIISEKYADKDDKTKVFIRKALKVHGNWYDYSKVEYKNAKTKVTIICPVHKDFEQTPTGHLSGRSCSECSELSRRKNTTICANVDYYSGLIYELLNIPRDLFLTEIKMNQIYKVLTKII